ncbi:hypothetical protein [Ferrimicrobium sp.]|uniref:hypothetical protein n=1 Tax=Ferrimicrobium sp. TaxID=2926050 RepID=UPI002611EE2B|nr:hypothetical protein [Ferrimicrobium sp.]
MTSMEIASLLEEPEIPGFDQEGDAPRRSRLFIVAVGVALLLGLGLGAYFLVSSHSSSASGSSPGIQQTTVPQPATARTAPAPIVVHTGGGAPVPSSGYFTVKNPFAPKIIQSGPASSPLPSG